MIAHLEIFCQPVIRSAAISIPDSFYPHFGTNIKKLKDFNPDTRRYRIGAWRFFYEIDETEKAAFVIRTFHRSGAF